MPVRESRAERARRRSRDTRLTIGNEVRSARLGSGLSQTVANHSVQISRAQWSRRDLQTLERRVALEQRDGAMAVVILLAADTRANRAVLAAHREQLRARFPLDSRQVLAALRSDTLPPQSGILAA